MTAESVGVLEILAVVAVSCLFSLGGGNGPLAVVQDRWVGKGLLDPGLFAWAIALGYLSPGPKAGFLSGVGYYLYGVPGAAAAIAGLVIPTWIGSAAVSYGYRKLAPVIAAVSLPAGFVIAGMIAAAAWDTAGPMALGEMEIAAAGMVAVAVAWRKPEPAFVVLGAALAGLGWYFLR